MSDNVWCEDWSHLREEEDAPAQSSAWDNWSDSEDDDGQDAFKDPQGCTICERPYAMRGCTIRYCMALKIRHFNEVCNVCFAPRIVTKCRSVCTAGFYHLESRRNQARLVEVLSEMFKLREQKMTLAQAQGLVSWLGLGDTKQKVDHALDILTPKIDDLCAKLNDMCAATMDGVSSLKNTLFPQTKDDWAKWLDGLGIIMSENYFFKKCHTMKDYIMWVIMVLSELKITGYVFKLIVGQCEKLFAPHEHPQAQGFDTSLIETFVSVIITIIAAVCLGAVPAVSNVKSFAGTLLKGVKEMSYIDKGIVSSFKLFELLQSKISDIFAWVLGEGSETYKYRNQLKELPAGICQWAKEVLTCCNEDFKLRLAFSEEDRDHIWKLHDRGVEICDLLAKCGLNTSILSTVQHLMKKLEPYVTAANRHKDGSSRIDPMCIMLYGVPNIGKSFLLTVIGNLIANEMKWRKEGRFYDRSATNYWDNYASQPIVRYDDFGQLDEMTNAVRTDLQDLMSMKSNNPMYLNMADCEDKGKPFSSKLILGATNVAYPRPPGIASLEACWRRRNMLIHVIVDPRYTVQEANQVVCDISQVPTQDLRNFEHLRFSLLPSTVPTPTLNDQEAFDNGMKWKDFLAYLRVQVKEYYKKATDSLNRNIGEYSFEDFLNEDQQNEVNDYLSIFREMASAQSNDAEFQDCEEQADALWDMLSRDNIVEPYTGPTTSLFEWKQITDVHPTLRERYIKFYGERFVRHDKFYNQMMEMGRIHGTDLAQECALAQLTYRESRQADNLYNKLVDWVKTIYEKPMVKTVLNWILLAGSGYALYKLWGWFSHDEETKAESQQKDKTIRKKFYAEGDQAESEQKDKSVKKKFYAEDSMLVKGKVESLQKEKVIKKKFYAEGAKAEGSLDQNATEIVDHVVLPYLCSVELHNDSLIGGKVNGFLVGGEFLLTVKHILLYEKDLKIVSGSRGTIIWKYDMSKVKQVNDKDAVLIYLGRQVAPTSDRLDHWISQNDLGKLGSFPGQLAVRRTCPTLLQGNISPHENLRYEADVFGSMNILHMRQGWKYNIATRSGDCGGVLVAQVKTVHSKLIGLHVAGMPDDNVGYSVLITREELREALNWFGDGVFKCPLPTSQGGEPIDLVDGSVKILPEGNFSIIGKVSRGVHQPSKTTLKKSAIFNLVEESKVEPAILSVSDPRNVNRESPLAKSIAKYGEVAVPFSPEELEEAGEWLFHKLENMQTLSPKRVLTDREVVNGNPEYKYWEGLTMDTSPGYPYIQMQSKGAGKKWLFKGEDQNLEIENEELRTRYQQREQDALKGERYPSLWVDCLKDEKRSLSKIKEVKTRTFTTPPVDFTLLCRKYCLAFSAAFMENRVNLPHAVGIDPTSHEWTQLLNYLREVSDVGFAGDFSSFDGKLSPQMIDKAFELIARWYGNNDKVYKVLASEIIHTNQIALDCVYTTHIGNPSGNPLTTILNSMVNMMYIYVAWMRLSKRHNPSLRMEFDKHVRFVVYGDDNLVSVSSLASWFNLKNVAEVFAENDIKYGSATKDGTVYDLEKITELTFLKRGFRRDEDTKHKWFAPLEKQSIVEMVNWIRESPDDLDALYENIDTSMRESVHHGKEWFDLFLRKLNHALKMRKLPTVYYRYQAMKVAWEGKSF